MPGPTHSAIVDLLAGRLDLIVELLGLVGIELPKFDYLEHATESLAPSQLGPFLPDLVVRLMRRRRSGPPECVEVWVIEVQGTPDATKIRAWALYGPLASALFRAPAKLIVVTTSHAVAAWARNLPEYGSVVPKPHVIGPDEIPFDVAQKLAKGAPLSVELAVLAAVTHARGPAADLALEVAVTHIAGLDNEQRVAHFLDMLSEQHGVRVMDLWEAMMPVAIPEYRSEWFRRMAKETHDHGMQQGMQQGVQQGLERGLVEGRTEGRTEGRDEGQALAKAESVLAILDARGLAVGAAVLERVRTTHDLATLDHWVRRAVVVACAEEVFDD